MGIIASTNYLAVFSAGIVLGAASTYIMLKSLQQSNGNSSKFKEKESKIFEPKDPNNEYRLIMGIRNDLKMQKGKVAAQCGHAAVEAFSRATTERPKTLKMWLRYGQAKIAVRVNSEQELLQLDKKAREMNVLSNIIEDAGHTQVESGSRTVIALGPAPKNIVDKITGHLKLY